VILADKNYRGGQNENSFSTFSGHYQFHRLPYGLSNSPASFQRLMDVVLKNLTGSETYLFMDEIIIFEETIREHVRRRDQVLQRFDWAKLQLQPGKCFFAQPRVQYLGYLVSQNGIAAVPDNVMAVRNYPVPRTEKDVRIFVGLASFYRRFSSEICGDTKIFDRAAKKEASFK
jgi:hypothetical protein